MFGTQFLKKKFAKRQYIFRRFLVSFKRAGVLDAPRSALLVEHATAGPCSFVRFRRRSLSWTGGPLLELLFRPITGEGPAQSIIFSLDRIF
jgi:hypothetical protein